MAGVGVMETPIDEVIDMIAMRYRLMPATGAVNMVRGGQLHERARGVIVPANAFVVLLVFHPHSIIPMIIGM